MRNQVSREPKRRFTAICQIAAALVLLAMGVGCSYAGNLRQWKRLAKHGDADAETHLGIAYYFGQGVMRDFVKSAYWFQKAADQGNAEAECAFGSQYFYGQGVPNNFATSVYWYQKAADQGYAGAQFNLGNAYWNGQGEPQNLALAVEWWRKAALQGYAPAQDSLANSYATGKGVTQDEATAVIWWTKVVAQGGALAQTAQQNIDVYYNRQQQKQLDAQEEAKSAEMLKKNAGECEIKFTVSNESRYSLWVGESFPGEHGGIFICDKDDCGTNLLILPGQNGFGTFTSIEPNYHESFKADPYYIFPYGSNTYYVKFILKVRTGFGGVKIYHFASPWYRTCERPTITFNPPIN